MSTIVDYVINVRIWFNRQNPGKGNYPGRQRYTLFRTIKIWIMELINNILSELFPILVIGLCLWIGAKNWNRIDRISRRLFGKGLEEE